MNKSIFMASHLPPGGIVPGPSGQVFARGANPTPMIPQELQDQMAALHRGEFTGDATALMQQFALTMQNFERAITSSTSGLPIRENLEAPARLLVPTDTPMRNRIPRVPGAGTAAAWRQITSVGGGYGLSTTVTSGANSATQTVGSTVGMYAGQSLYFATAGVYRIVSSVTNATTVVLTASVNSTTSEVVTIGPYFQPGADAAAIRAFFAESGAPADHVTAYASKSASYKLLGTYFSITGFAMAAGATYQNQREMEMLNAIRQLMLNEENAIINGSSTSTAAPWGDGSNALGFDGMINLVTTGNGTPADQVQTSVGALTTAHIDAQLTRLWKQGASDMWMLMNGQEVNSLAHLAEASGSIIRVNASMEGDAVLGIRVLGYKHPVTGELVKIIASRFLSAGTIIFGCDKLPDGSPALQMNVLPQVQLPQLAPNESVQGYVAQELAPTTSAPQVYPGIVTVYEVLQAKSANHFAKSTGVTAV